MEEEKNNSKPLIDKLKEESEKIIENILNEGIQIDNIDVLSKMEDIHKDISNEEYWQNEKEEKHMRYRNYGRENYGTDVEQYGNYGRRMRDSRGRYTGDNYGRRGVDSKYRGEEIMDDMMYHYGNYSAGQEQYGADEETMKSFKYMLKSFKDYYKHLKQEATSQEQVKMLEETAEEMLDM